MKNYLFLSFFLLYIFNSFSHQKADLVMFSFDRPLQLDVLLNSIKKFVSNIGDIFVVYRASNEFFEEGFSKVRERFPHIIFKKQSENYKEDFKPLVLEAVFQEGKSEYVFFAVDDQVFTDYVDLDYCISRLQKYKVYAFYLRLGMHFDWCYSAQVPQVNPLCQEVEKNLCLWTFNDGSYEFCYPHDTVSGLYRKKDIKKDLYDLPYYSPNTMEGVWATVADTTKKGLCFEKAVTLMLPLNRVQQDNTNISMEAFTSEELNEKYLDNFTFDVSCLYGIRNNACCYEYIPAFIPLG